MVSEHRAVEQDDGFGAWIRRVAEVVNVAIWAEAAQDGGAGWGVNGLALGTNRDFAVVADADAGLLAPDVGPPRALGSGTDDRAVFGEGLLVGGVGCLAEFAVDFVLVGVGDELVEQLVGPDQFNDLVSGQEGDQAFLPVVVAANPTFTASYGGWLNGDTTSALSGSPALTTVAATNSPVGSYTISAAVGTLSAANYSFSFTNGILTVGKATLIVAADNKARAYGETNPVFTASYSGWLNDDTAAVLSGASSLATLAATNSPIGDYAIAAAIGTLSATNYSFAFTNGILSVGRAILTVSADAKSRNYGARNPTLTASYSGWLNGDTAAVLAGAPALACAAATNSPVGSYTITVSAGTLSATNYSLAFTNGLLAVNRAPITITATATNRAYGAANPVLTGTVVGVVNRENITGLYSTLATETSPAGTYSIAPSLSDPDGKLGNYNVTTNSALLTITKAVLAVVADNKSRFYGDVNPTFTASYSGWLNSDSVAVLAGAPSLTTFATTNSAIGNYTITAAAGSLSATNYSFAFTNGLLTVNRAAMTITANATNRAYGAANPVFTGRSSV